MAPVLVREGDVLKLHGEEARAGREGALQAEVVPPPFPMHEATANWQFILAAANIVCESLATTRWGRVTPATEVNKRK